MFIRNGSNSFGSLNDGPDRFTAKPTSFAYSSNSGLVAGAFSLGVLALLIWLFFFAVFAGAFVLAFYNFFLLFSGSGDGLNVFFGLCGVFVLYLYLNRS